MSFCFSPNTIFCKTLILSTLFVKLVLFRHFITCAGKEWPISALRVTQRSMSNVGHPWCVVDQLPAEHFISWGGDMTLGHRLWFLPHFCFSSPHQQSHSNLQEVIQRADCIFRWPCWNSSLIKQCSDMHGHPRGRLGLELTGWKITSLLDFKYTGGSKYNIMLNSKGKRYACLLSSALFFHCS